MTNENIEMNKAEQAAFYGLKQAALTLEKVWRNEVSGRVYVKTQNGVITIGKRGAVKWL